MKQWVILILLFCCSLSFGQTILIVGDSLTEGYGLDPSEAYPVQLEILLKAQGHPSAKGVNGGISGSTTASGVQRVKWYAKLKPQILVLALGANDGLRGLKVADSQKNLEATILAAQAAGMKVLLAGMQMPVNYGAAYRKEFEAMYTTLSKKFKVPLMPFMLAGVGGVPKLNLADGMHPNAEGQKIVAGNILRGLKGHL